MYELGSDAWLKALCEAINNSQAYADAAKTWEGDFYFIVDAGGAVPKEIVMHVDLWHGKCRGAYQVTDRAQENPAFVINAAEGAWRLVIEKKLDPIQGLMTRQLKLKGDMIKVMKAVKAAKELVECTTKVPTKFPSDQ
jgi:putative sterol carrier protein